MWVCARRLLFPCGLGTPLISPPRAEHNDEVSKRLYKGRHSVFGVLTPTGVMLFLPPISTHRGSWDTRWATASVLCQLVPVPWFAEHLGLDQHAGRESCVREHRHEHGMGSS
jgi:hypothetical protein